MRSMTEGSHAFVPGGNPPVAYGATPLLQGGAEGSGHPLRHFVPPPPEGEARGPSGAPAPTEGIHSAPPVGELSPQATEGG